MAERREFVGRLIAAGATRTLTGEAGRYMVTAAALRRAIDDGLFRGLACFVDHAGQPSVRRLAGVWAEVQWDEAAAAVVGRLRLYDTAITRPVADLLEQTLDEAERPDLGVSLVFYPRLAEDGRTIREIVMVESADLVMFPASPGSRVVARDGIPRPGSPVARDAIPRPSSPVARDAIPRPSGAAVASLMAWPAGGWKGGQEFIPRHGYTRDGGARHGDMREIIPRYKVTENFAVMEETMNEMDDMVEMVAEGTGSDVGRTAEDATHRRVRLVARGRGRAAGGDPWAATQLPLPLNPVVEKEMRFDAQLAKGFDDGQEAMLATVARHFIQTSGLPQPMQERLMGWRYESMEEVDAVIAQARRELAALNEAGVVRLSGIGGAGGGLWGSGKVQRAAEGASHRVWVNDPLDVARDLVGFFFGAAGAPEPPPNLRSFADLYVALTGDVHFRGVFDGDRAQFSGATTTTLPNLAVDAMNRVIVQQFQALDHYRWYERISSVEPNDGSLQAMKWLTLGGIGNLPTVTEGAAYSELSVADVKETSSFVKRGGYVGITREMIRNSNIMQLQAIPRALAAAAVRTRSAAVAALFTAGSGVGPTLAQDSKALFHADHDNLATTALGTDAAAWRAARAECFRHAEVGSSKALGIYPRFLLVPAELYDTALTILGYGEGMPTAYTPEAQSRGFADPRPIPLVVPDWTDSADWAYVVDPAVYPVIQMSYSQTPGGRRHPIPELFAVVSDTSGLMFSNDILPIKVRDEFALGVNGHRGIGKRNVA